ncbi:MAG: ATP synthase subunit I [Deltaproteobacteria bacterium]|nr:ATP synthase subunit I [Deltaproteobacteria bacterium]
MAGNAVKTSTAATSAALKVGLLNAAVGLLGSGVLLVLKSSLAPGFAAGFMLGGVNALLLLKIARKGVGMPADKAGRYVTVSYFVRFILTAVILALLIYRGFLTPWPLLAGITASLFTTIGVLIGIARKEASQDA